MEKILAIALSGAILIKEDGRMMTYEKKCDRCGALQPGSTYTQSPTGSSTTLQSSFRCFKCGSQVQVRIRGQ